MLSVRKRVIRSVVQTLEISDLFIVERSKSFGWSSQEPTKAFHKFCYGILWLLAPCMTFTAKCVLALWVLFTCFLFAYFVNKYGWSFFRGLESVLIHEVRWMRTSHVSGGRENPGIWFLGVMHRSNHWEIRLAVGDNLRNMFVPHWRSNGCKNYGQSSSFHFLCPPQQYNYIEAWFYELSCTMLSLLQLYGQCESAKITPHFFSYGNDCKPEQ